MSAELAGPASTTGTSGQIRTDWVVTGVPSSAGAHHAGQEQAPAALRSALVLTEVNPTYDGDGSQLDSYLKGLTSALTP